MAADDNMQLSLMPERDVYSVTRLNRAVRQRLEGGFATLWIEGEISNLRRPASGHWYFTLKDERAQVRCAMFASRNRRVAFAVADGLKVLLKARLSVYEPRGEYQLAVDEMEPSGEGALQRAFEALKKKLAAEGLFDAARKKPLPRLPRRIGVVTSASGAALRDVLKVLRRRFPAIPVLIYPVSVQGDAAPAEIVATLRLAARRGDCDVLILTRGGGSLEDLQAFNEERVARAVAACELPIICGVGHEIDFTISDLAADRRAPTPSAAAEMVVPDAGEWLRNLYGAETMLSRAMQRRITAQRQRLSFVQRALQQQHPGRRLAQRAQRLDELEHRLRGACRQRQARAAARLASLTQRLVRVSPRKRLADTRERTARARTKLESIVQQRLSTWQRRASVAARALDAVSPLATLARGYAIVSVANDDDSRRIVRDAAELRRGETVEARVARGTIVATVTSTRKNDR